MATTPRSPGARGDVRPYVVDEEAHLTTLWRTLAIEATLERFRCGEVHLPPLETLPADYPAHLGAVVRQNVEVAGGQVRAEYRSIGPDDYLHAEVYCLAALELLWRRIGLNVALGQAPVALLDPADAVDLTSYGDESSGLIYRPGFDDDDPFGSPGGYLG